MADRDPRIDTYIAARADFARPILCWLRDRVHAAVPGVGETIKWGMPFFTLAGRPFANMAAFRAHASFGFWQRDANRTGREGEAMGQFGRIASLADLPDAATFESIVRDAAAVPPACTPRRNPAVAEIDPAFRIALEAHADAARHFAAFPPGAQREYVGWIADAKTDSTRERRIETAVGWIALGKRRNWKYESG